MRKIWETPGGVHPPQNKAQSTADAIGTVPLPDKLILPLNQHIGAPARPLVKAGDPVLKGQTIAEPAAFVSAAVHAPTSGTVEAVADHPIPHPSGMSVPCITIVPDGEERWIEHRGVDDYRQLSVHALLALVRDAGIAGLGGAGFPTEVKLGPGRPVDTLIINGTECEPYITADDMLMRERAADIVEGIEIIRHMVGGAQETLIGIEDNKPEAYDALLPHLEGKNIELVEFPTKYPSGGEKQLIQILTGKEVPSGELPIDLGIVCQNIGTTYAVQRAICHGEPLISRITTMTGEALSVNRNFEVLLGTPVSHLLAHCGFREKDAARLIMGGPMMGFTLQNPEVPVIKTTNCLLAPSRPELPPEPLPQACIRCGLCAEACPASLLPQQLYWYAQSRNHERLEAHNLFDCIECGACAYVCPSHIPLVQYYRAAKGEIRHEEAERRKADHARQRFEFHKERQEKAEAEKAAKREARRKAAEEAKKKQGDGQDKAKGGADDIIKMAMEKAAARKASPEQQQAKAERAVQTAQIRLSAVREKLAQAESEGAATEQLDRLRAQVEEGSIKLEDARRKCREQAQSEVIAEKMAASPRQKLEKSIASLKQRIATTEAKLDETDDANTVEALRAGLDKQRTKLADAERELARLGDDAGDSQPSDGSRDAAADAIARAQAKARQREQMTPAQKRETQIDSLRQRIAKAETKLAEAEAEGADHVDTLRTSLQKLRDKLQALESETAEER